MTPAPAGAALSASPELAVGLRDATLAWHGARAAVPRYRRDALRPGVVHLSVGVFHRSHQAVYFDDLAAAGARDWGTIGVGLRRAALGAALRPQDALYTVVSRSPSGDEARVIGVMTGYLHAARERRAVLAALTDERTALVTLTVTGAAYRPPEAGADVRAYRGDPVGAMDHLVEALDCRRRAGVAPFTVLSCDNLPANGDLARDAVLAYAERRDPRLATWIAERIAFPNSMVDRITPQTTDADRAMVQRDFGIADRCPVITEPFRQWVVEDRFCNRRPPLDAVGVQLVDDVAPYALTKTRLLNASHCAIGYLGSLAGLSRTDEFVADPLLRRYVEHLMGDEIAPLLPEVAGLDLADYRRTLLERLANPAIADELCRLCRGGSGKVPAHVLPSIAQAVAQGRPHRLLVLAIAAWMRYLRGVDEQGGRLELDDPLSGRLRTLALARGTGARPLLDERAVFGALGDDPSLVAELEDALDRLDRRGVRGAIADALAADTGATR